jgi:hypothetical protein
VRVGRRFQLRRKGVHETGALMERLRNKRQVSPRHTAKLRRFTGSNTVYKATVILRTSYETVDEILGGGFVRLHVAKRLENLIDRVIP